MEKVEKKIEFDTIKVGRTIYHIMFGFISYSGQQLYLASYLNRDKLWEHKILCKGEDGKWFVHI